MRVWYSVPLIFALTTVSLASQVYAQDEFLPDPELETPLNAAEVKDWFSGQTHRGSYNFEVKNFEGYHFEELTAPNGKTFHRMGSRVDTGQWRQVKDQICFTYDAPDLVPACFSFYLRGNCIYHYQQSVNGQPAPRFTAVTVLKGESPSCEPPMS